MAKRRTRTIAGLQRAWNARSRRGASLYNRPYVLRPALVRHLDRYEHLKQIGDDAERYRAFRLVPALEYDLEAIDRSLTADERVSLAQRDRATRPRIRLTKDRHTLETIIFQLLNELEDPWQKKAKQYWFLVIERLKTLGLNPTRIIDPAQPSNEWLEYDGGGGRRSLRQGHFQNLVSAARKNIPHGFN